MELYLAQFHHNHGVSATVIIAANIQAADKEANRIFLEDGMEADETRREEIGEWYEVYKVRPVIAKQ